MTATCIKCGEKLTARIKEKVLESAILVCSNLKCSNAGLLCISKEQLIKYNEEFLNAKPGNN